MSTIPKYPVRRMEVDERVFVCECCGREFIATDEDAHVRDAENIEVCICAGCLNDPDWPRG